MGLLFFVGALAKISYLPSLQRDISELLGLSNGARISASLASLTISWEALLGISLIIWGKRRITIVLTLVTLFAFSIYLISLSAAVKNCGCFGFWMEMSPNVALLKNSACIVLCLLCLKGTVNQTMRLREYCLLSIVLFVATLSLSPLAEVETDKPNLFLSGAVFKHTRVNAHLADRALMVFLSADCEHCKKLGIYLSSNKSKLPPLFLNFMEAAETTVVSFLSATNLTSAPWSMTSIDLFFDNIGSHPPRVYLLTEGTVINFWDQGFTLESLPHDTSN